MNSIAFPVMFTNTTTKVVEGHEATAQNLRLLLYADRGGLFGDPYYGSIIKKLMFDQNDIVLRDIVIDAIYTLIQQFMPQIKVDRKNITIVQQGTAVYVTIKVKYMLDYTTDMYTINLLDYEVK